MAEAQEAAAVSKGYRSSPSSPSSTSPTPSPPPAATVHGGGGEAAAAAAATPATWSLAAGDSGMQASGPASMLGGTPSGVGAGRRPKGFGRRQILPTLVADELRYSNVDAV